MLGRNTFEVCCESYFWLPAQPGSHTQLNFYHMEFLIKLVALTAFFVIQLTCWTVAVIGLLKLCSPNRGNQEVD